MKKIVLMFAFAGFATFAASAQTEATASTTNKAAKKEDCTKVCTPEEKAACVKMVGTKSCCASGKASATSTAAKTEKATVANKKAVASTGNK